MIIRDKIRISELYVEAAYQLCTRKTPNSTKPRPILVRFVLYVDEMMDQWNTKHPLEMNPATVEDYPQELQVKPKKLSPPNLVTVVKRPTGGLVACCILFVIGALRNYNYLRLTVEDRWIGSLISIRGPAVERPWLLSCFKVNKSQKIYGGCEFYPNDTSILYNLPLAIIRRSSVDGSYKNPCWFEANRSAEGLRCLPYVYVLGVAKSGTSSLYNNLLSDDHITKGQRKEIFWWGNVRRRITFRKYISYFDRSAQEIYHAKGIQKFTLDATPSYFTRQGDLSLLPGNRQSSGPRYTLADTLYRLYPKTRLIVILRHPVDRLYSHYRHWFRQKASFSPEEFHRKIRESVEMMKRCLAKNSLKSCAFNHTLLMITINKDLVPVSDSMYFPFAKSWLDVFPRSQTLFIKAEDYYANMTSVMNRIFTFLGLGGFWMVRKLHRYGD
ncbi:hypothetical protein LSH36_1749g00003 [Paralvinella palmiformis]|uniref:Sulfotransferase domain-containing protein n=1 Tax=Paralvinella palmiformis TaxID=53620 RepID=A0AAD9MN08_9ANNE|nr:hypothetical protein LSH36_1749g00003 [Paralvinella palmiformis]